MIDLESVAHGLLRDTKGGAKVVAALAGMNQATLSHKCNPNMDTHHLSANEALSIQMVTGDHRILQAEAEALGYALTPLERVDSEDFMRDSLRTVRSFGEFICACGDALADGRVTQNELKVIEKDLRDVQARIAQLHASIAAKVGRR